MAKAGTKGKGVVPGPAEFGLQNAWLATRGYTPAQRKACLGETVSGRSRGQISDHARKWYNGLGT